jgi:hypothetical protein
MNKFLLVLVCFIILVMSNCTSSKKASEGDKPAPPPPLPTVTTSFGRDILPMMTASCAPCHFPGGSKKMLDTYAAVNANAGDVLSRVSLDPADVKFMPKGKKPAFTADQISKFKTWMAEGKPE